jgi:large subunit ribosomal protein L9
VVFFQDVEGTAQVGDVKDVRNGFARNFLLPRGLAGPTTKENLFRAEGIAKKESRRQAKLDADAQGVAARIGSLVVTVEARVGESGRLFGSVTNRDIAERLNAATGLDVDPHIILLPEPIRELGERAVPIRLSRNVHVDVTVNVVPDADSAAAVAKLMAEIEDKGKDEESAGGEDESGEE